MVLAGTTEGRQLALELQKRGYPVVASVATDYGASLLYRAGVKQVIRARLTGTLWNETLSAHRVSVVVDATHPYAVEVSKQAMEACSGMNIPYIRLERPPAQLPGHQLVHKAAGLPRAVDLAFAMGETCFCTLGSKHLEYIMEKAGERRVRVVARVLPDPQIVAKCIDLGIEKSNLIAMQGPASREINRALYKFYRPSVVLTKESGVNGGLEEKIAPALELQIPVVVWQRPKLDYPVKLSSIEEVLTRLHGIIGGNGLNGTIRE
nr:precorrin-6A reductase [Desulforadius tongensis]